MDLLCDLSNGVLLVWHAVLSWIVACFDLRVLERSDVAKLGRAARCTHLSKYACLSESDTEHAAFTTE